MSKAFYCFYSLILSTFISVPPQKFIFNINWPVVEYRFFGGLFGGFRCWQFDLEDLLLVSFIGTKCYQTWWWHLMSPDNWAVYKTHSPILICPHLGFSELCFPNAIFTSCRERRWLDTLHCSQALVLFEHKRIIEDIFSEVSCLLGSFSFFYIWNKIKRKAQWRLNIPSSFWYWKEKKAI